MCMHELLIYKRSLSSMVMCKSYKSLFEITLITKVSCLLAYLMGFFCVFLYFLGGKVGHYIGLLNIVFESSHFVSKSKP